MGQPLSVSLKNNVRCSPTPSGFFSEISEFPATHTCMCHVGVLVQGCGELPLQAICPIGTMHAWSPCASLWGKILTWQAQFFCCCDCCMHCTHVSCKKVLFEPGGLGGKCIDKLNLLLLCVSHQPSQSVKIQSGQAWDNPSSSHQPSQSLKIQSGQAWDNHCQFP